MEFDYSIDLAVKTQNDAIRQYNTLLQLYTIQNQYKDPNRVINVLDLVKTGELDNYSELYKRYKDSDEKALGEKTKLIMELTEVAQTPKLDGSPLIDDATLEAGILDIINNDNELTVVEEIFKTYEAYQQEVMALEQDLTNQAVENEQMAQEKQGNAQQEQANIERQNLLTNKLGVVADGVQGL